MRDTCVIHVRRKGAVWYSRHGSLGGASVISAVDAILPVAVKLLGSDPTPKLRRVSKTIWEASIEIPTDSRIHHHD